MTILPGVRRLGSFCRRGGQAGRQRARGQESGSWCDCVCCRQSWWRPAQASLPALPACVRAGRLAGWLAHQLGVGCHQAGDGGLKQQRDAGQALPLLHAVGTAGEDAGGGGRGQDACTEVGGEGQERRLSKQRAEKVSRRSTQRQKRTWPMPAASSADAPLPQAAVKGGMRMRWPACSRVDCCRPGLTASRSAMLARKMEAMPNTKSPCWTAGGQGGGAEGQAAGCQKTQSAVCCAGIRAACSLTMIPATQAPAHPPA